MISVEVAEDQVEEICVFFYDSLTFKLMRKFCIIATEINMFMECVDLTKGCENG